MSQAVKSLADYAIHNLKMHRVFAEPYTTNPASARVLKAGFLCEGILRSNAFKDGEDQYLYTLIGKNSTQPIAPLDAQGHAATGVR